MRLQLLLQDKCGLTLAMHASRGGSAVVLASVMAEVRGVKVRVDQLHSTSRKQGVVVCHHGNFHSYILLNPTTLYWQQAWCDSLSPR